MMTYDAHRPRELHGRHPNKSSHITSLQLHTGSLLVCHLYARVGVAIFHIHDNINIHTNIINWLR
jgi:hypothetical protein